MKETVKNNSVFESKIGAIANDQLSIYLDNNKITIPIDSIKKTMLFRRKKLHKNYIFFFTSTVLIAATFFISGTISIVALGLFLVSIIITFLIKDFDYIFLIVKDYDFFEIKINKEYVEEAKKMTNLLKKRIKTQQKSETE